MQEIFLRRLRDLTEYTSFLRNDWNVLKTSRKRDLFKMYLRHLKDAIKKGIIFYRYLRQLKDVTKTVLLLRCFWEVFEMFLSMEILLSSLKGISCGLRISFSYLKFKQIFEVYFQKSYLFGSSLRLGRCIVSLFLTNFTMFV